VIVKARTEKPGGRFRTPTRCWRPSTPGRTSGSERLVGAHPGASGLRRYGQPPWFPEGWSGGWRRDRRRAVCGMLARRAGLFGIGSRVAPQRPRRADRDLSHGSQWIRAPEPPRRLSCNAANAEGCGAHHQSQAARRAARSWRALYRRSTRRGSVARRRQRRSGRQRIAPSSRMGARRISHSRSLRGPQRREVQRLVSKGAVRTHIGYDRITRTPAWPTYNSAILHRTQPTGAASPVA